MSGTTSTAGTSRRPSPTPCWRRDGTAWRTARCWRRATLTGVGGPSWTSGSFASGFSSAPVVLASVNTRNAPDAVAPRLRNITASGFEATLQEQELDDQAHPGETLDYLAIQAGSGSGWKSGLLSNVTHNNKNLPLSTVFSSTPPLLANIQTYNGLDTSALRYNGAINNGTLSVWVKVEEEKSKDSETAHGNETVGYLAHDPGDLLGESYMGGAWVDGVGSPHRPTDVTITSEGNTVRVTWEDRSSDETGFEVETSTDGGATWVSSALVGADAEGATIINMPLDAVVSARVRTQGGTGVPDGVVSAALGTATTGSENTSGLYRVRLAPSGMHRGSASFDFGPTPNDLIRLGGDTDNDGEVVVQARSWKHAVEQAVYDQAKLTIPFGPRSGETETYNFGTQPGDASTGDYYNEGFDIRDAGPAMTVAGYDQLLVLEDLRKLDPNPRVSQPGDAPYDNDEDYNDWYWGLDVEYVGEVDLDVDSDSDDGFSTPDRSVYEESVEDVAGQPGKVLRVNNNDDDLDGIPDYYDGFDADGLTGTADDRVMRVNGKQTIVEQFVPIKLEMPAGLDPTITTFTFDYTGSAPGSPVDGQVRLWRVGGDPETLHASDDAEDAGVTQRTADHYIAPAQRYSATSLGFTSDQHVVTLWTESLRASSDPGDARIEVSIDADDDGSSEESQAVRFSSIGLRYAWVTEGGDLIATEELPTSQPAPAFTAADISVVGSLRPSDDGSEILADVRFAGVLDDPLADITPGGAGVIDKLSAFRNGGSLDQDVTVPSENFGVTSYTKRDGDGPLLKPYDFEATFDHVSEGVAVASGWNHFTVAATNQYSYHGTASAAFQVQTRLTPTFLGLAGDPYVDETVDLAVVREGDDIGKKYRLQRSADSLSTFVTTHDITDPDPSNHVIIAASVLEIEHVDGGASDDFRRFKFTSDEHGIHHSVVDMELTGVNSLGRQVFTGTDSAATRERIDWRDYEIWIEEDTQTARSAFGNLHAVAVEIQMPEELLGEASLADELTGAARGITRYGDALYMEDVHLRGRPSLYVSATDPRDLEAQIPATVKPPDEGVNEESFSDGLVEGLLSPITDLWDTGKTIIELGKRAQEI